MPRDAASKAAARRRSTAWAARCSAAVERSPAAQATPTPRSAGISHSSTTLSNEPRLKRSSRIAASRAGSRSRAASTSSLSAPSPPAGGARAGGEGAEGERADSELVDAARDLDTARLAAILDDRFSRGSFESVVDEWLMPALRGVGVAWAAGDLSTAAEHLAAHAVLRRLAAQHGVGGQVPVSYT